MIANQELPIPPELTTWPSSITLDPMSSEIFESRTTGADHAKVLGKPTITVLSAVLPKSQLHQQQVLDKNRKIKEFSSEFYRIIEHDHFEFGVTSNIERYVDNWIARDLKTTQLALAQIFYENQLVEKISIGILKILAHVDASILSPTNRGIAMNALTLPSLEVRECAVRAYEYWEDPDFLVDLEIRQLEPAWLEEYKQTVITEVRG